MARRKAAARKNILPDPLFENALIAKFVNVVMRRGKKAVAEKIVYGALDTVLQRQKNTAKGSSKDNDNGSVAVSDGKVDGGVASIKSSAVARKAALELFEKVLHTVRPAVEVKSRRVGGANYQVPVEVNEEHGIALAMRWLAECSKSRGEKSMALRLAGEILEALDGKGGAMKKREDTHRMAKANQAFAHYRW